MELKGEKSVVNMVCLKFHVFGVACKNEGERHTRIRVCQVHQWLFLRSESHERHL